MADAPSVISVTIRQVDRAVVRKLRVRAAERGRSMEAELRLLLAAIANGEVING